MIKAWIMAASRRVRLHFIHSSIHLGGGVYRHIFNTLMNTLIPCTANECTYPLHCQWMYLSLALPMNALITDCLCCKQSLSKWLNVHLLPGNTCTETPTKPTGGEGSELLLHIHTHTYTHTHTHTHTQRDGQGEGHTQSDLGLAPHLVQHRYTVVLQWAWYIHT